jgi:N-acetylneuraminate synthase/N,N'-diacetyllegionaminate synthase
MNDVVIIAEAGVNHNGDLNKAIDLIKHAADAGADYIKFQTFITELNIAIDAPKAKYQTESNDESTNQFDMVKKLELSFTDFEQLRRESKKHHIGFLTTAFDLPSLDFIEKMNLDYIKIPSGEITNLPFLIRIAQMNRSIILSTGMAEMEEIKRATEILFKHGVDRSKIIILHCNTEYPTPMQDVNLKAMNFIGDQLNVQIGYSDHTLGIEVPIAAVALGARVIEKHFTLDRTMKGPDHAASLEPDELKKMVQSIRNIELAVSGSGLKTPSPSELKNKDIARKSIHLSRSMDKGEVIQDIDLAILRPGNGISPMDIEHVIGKELKHDLKKQSQLSWKDLN